MKYLRVLIAVLLVVCMAAICISCVKNNTEEQNGTQSVSAATIGDTVSDAGSDASGTNGDSVSDTSSNSEGSGMSVAEDTDNGYGPIHPVK